MKAKQYTVHITVLVMSPAVHKSAVDGHQTIGPISVELFKYHRNAKNADAAAASAVAKHFKTHASLNRPFSVTLVEHHWL